MPAEQQSKLSSDTEYQQIHENIRATDDISFKLMSLVPLITGGAVSLLANSQLSWGITCFISGFAATAAFGIFRWELRNIQSCNWQRARAEKIDSTNLPDAPELRSIRRRNAGRKPVNKNTKERLFRIGKTQAEIIIYFAVILAWLLLPSVDGLWRLRGTERLIGVVVSFALGLGLAAWIALSLPTFDSLKPPIDKESVRSEAPPSEAD